MNNRFINEKYYLAFQISSIHTYTCYWLVPQWGFSESDLHYIKNPNWWEADKLSIYKRGRGNETCDCPVTSTWRELNPGCWIPSPLP